MIKWGANPGVAACVDLEKPRRVRSESAGRTSAADVPANRIRDVIIVDNNNNNNNNNDTIANTTINNNHYYKLTNTIDDRAGRERSPSSAGTSRNNK